MASIMAPRYPNGLSHVGPLKPLPGLGTTSPLSVIGGDHGTIPFASLGPNTLLILQGVIAGGVI